jgi:Domain of unknown function (DUF309)
MLDEEQLHVLKQGVDLFNEAEFFEAHEFFEELWQQANEAAERDEFLFLVRLAAAGVHLLNQNFSALFLFMLARKQLNDGLNLQYCGLNGLKLDDTIASLETSSRAGLMEIAKDVGTIHML